MKSFADCAKDDRKIVEHCFRNYNMTPEHAKNKRKQELAAESFRVDGRIMNIHERRLTQSKRFL